jgi:hypothetical protein
MHGTYVCKSLAAFFASTVLPRSVASFRMRAFTGSVSVTATVTSVLRVQLMSSDLAVQGAICNMHCQRLGPKSAMTGLR